MTLAEIAAVTGGVVDPSDAGVVVTAEAFIDSRAAVAGGLFVAFEGERVDGHAYAASSVEAGAAAALASKPVGVPAVLVTDMFDALARLARHVRRQLHDLTVVGVTGSQGKTSTKDMLGEILGATAPTVASRGSQNNEIGGPVTVTRVTRETRYLVSELGAAGLGHIAFLADIVAPTVGIVLNVGVAHIGGFGSQDGIAAAKGELVEALPADGLAVLNIDDARVLAMSARTAAPVLTFGRAESADVRLSDVVLDDDGHPALRLHWHGRSAELTLGYVGEHQAMNAAAAAAASLGLGVDLDTVASALAAATPRSRWRMEVTTNPDGVVVINDAYNANPDSMRAGLTALVDISERRGGARTVAVLGEMCELGDSSAEEHRRLGRLVTMLGIDRLIVVGERATQVNEAALREPAWSGATLLVPDVAAALVQLRAELREGDVVLVKASRAAGLEKVAVVLASGWEPARQPQTRTGGER